MLKILSIRNAKRQARDYLFYFITVICAVSFMFGFNSLVFSDAIQSQGQLEVLPYMIVFTSILIIFILGWLVSYMTNFMLRKRSKELSTYMILGITNKSISKLFFLETLLMGMGAFVLGIFFGSFIAKIIEAVILKLFGQTYHFTLALSIPAVGLTGLYFIFIFIFALRRNNKIIRKMKLYDLLYYDKKNDDVMFRKQKSTLCFFVISILVGIGGFLVFVYMPVGKGFDVLIGLSLVVFFLFGFFASVPAFLSLALGDNTSWKYRKNHLIIFRSFTSKMASTSMTMSILSILFALALTSIGTVIVFNRVLERSIELNVFDIMILHVDESMDSTEYKEDIEEFSQVQSDLTYNIYTDSSTLFKEICDLTIERKDGSILTYAEFRNDTYMKYSDYLKLREMLGIGKVELGENEYMIHCVSDLADEYLKEMKQIENVQINGNTLSFGSIQTELLNQYDPYGNGLNYIIIVPDEAAEDMTVVYSIYAVITESSVGSIQLDGLREKNDKLAIIDRNTMVSSTDINGGLPTMLFDKSKDYISGKWALKETFIAVYSIMLSLLYLALILEITGAAILVTQLFSDSAKNRQQYDILKNIGMSKGQVKKVINKQLVSFFLLPLIPALIISSTLVSIIAGTMNKATYNFSVFSSYLWIVQSIGGSVVLFLILYGLYFIAVSVSYRKGVME